jgi:hypothetical protein
MSNFEFAYRVTGANTVPVIIRLPVAATQTLVSGDAVVLSSGKVAKASTAFGRCLGVMAQTSTSAAEGTLVEIYVASPDQVWRATASADATSYVLDGTRTYDLNSSQVVNVADTTGGSIQILGLVNAVTTAIYINITACVFA